MEQLPSDRDVTFAEQLLAFLANLEWPEVPKDVEVMNPYAEAKAWALTQTFYRKYYSDNRARTLIIGINPGRFGGGVTGIPFTDPLKLQDICGIENSLARKQELSSTFIYHMITAFGGPEAFYQHFCFSAVSPVGFTMNGKNLNYYDHKELQTKPWVDFMTNCFESQLQMGVNREVAYVLGQGQNLNFLSKLNDENGFFKRLEVLPHPRWVMQYRLRRLEEFINVYIDKLSVHT
ncbi:MAG: DUF4918 family protein [Imperialibacter sp.]